MYNMEASNNRVFGSLEQEIREIHEKFPSIPTKTIPPILLKYTGLQKDERIRCTLHDLFQYNDTNYTKEAFNADVLYIMKLFPNACVKEIATQLKLLGKVISRVEIVVKDLLADQKRKILKRRYSEIAGPSDYIQPKRLFLNSMCETNGTDNNNSNRYYNPINNNIRVLNPAENGIFEFSKPSTSWQCPLPIKQEKVQFVKTEPIECQSTAQPQVVTANEMVKIDLVNSEEDEDDVAISEVELSDVPDDNIDTRLLYHVMEMFPDADPKFLREQVRNKVFNEAEIGFVIDNIINIPNYPKRNVRSPEPEDDVINPDVKIETLRDILPDADPTYLMSSLQNISTEKEFQAFVSKCLETHNYPTYKEYLRKQQLSSQVKQYTTEFSVQKFIELIPDPEAYFNSTKCKATLINKKSDTYYFIYNFLRNLFPMICVKQIKSVLEKSCTITETCLKLKYTKMGILRSKRKSLYSLDGLTDIPLLQVFAYLEHKDDIIKYINEQKVKDQEEREEAKKNGVMKTCGCCFDEEVMPRDMVTCDAGCEFCKRCVEQSVKILFYEQKIEFPCLMECGSQFGIQTLQKTLKPKIFSKLVQKKQLEEIKSAGVEDIEFCPFCDFATILAPENKLFVCLNPECMKESCRLCKETSHIPLRCEEVEKDEDVKRRTYIENKMTEALLRKCLKCGMTFIKADGCNKMTCSCGAMMCYICNKPVENYKHFNGQGGDQYNLCPLYSDTNALHRDAVLKGAAIAKQELGEAVKIDPTIGVEDYYKEEMLKNPSIIPPGMNLI